MKTFKFIGPDWKLGKAKQTFLRKKILKNSKNSNWLDAAGKVDFKVFY